MGEWTRWSVTEAPQSPAIQARLQLFSHREKSTIQWTFTNRPGSKQWHIHTVHLHITINYIASVSCHTVKNINY